MDFVLLDGPRIFSDVILCRRHCYFIALLTARLLRFNSTTTNKDHQGGFFFFFNCLHSKESGNLNARSTDLDFLVGGTCGEPVYANQ